MIFVFLFCFIFFFFFFFCNTQQTKYNNFKVCSITSDREVRYEVGTYLFKHWQINGINPSYDLFNSLWIKRVQNTILTVPSDWSNQEIKECCSDGEVIAWPLDFKQYMKYNNIAIASEYKGYQHFIIDYDQISTTYVVADSYLTDLETKFPHFSVKLGKLWTGFWARDEMIIHVTTMEKQMQQLVLYYQPYQSDHEQSPEPEEEDDAKDTDYKLADEYNQNNKNHKTNNIEHDSDTEMGESVIYTRTRNQMNKKDREITSNNNISTANNATNEVKMDPMKINETPNDAECLLFMFKHLSRQIKINLFKSKRDKYQFNQTYIVSANSIIPHIQFYNNKQYGESLFKMKKTTKKKIEYYTTFSSGYQIPLDYIWNNCNNGKIMSYRLQGYHTTLDRFDMRFSGKTNKWHFQFHIKRKKGKGVWIRQSTNKTTKQSLQTKRKTQINKS